MRAMMVWTPWQWLAPCLWLAAWLGIATPASAAAPAAANPAGNTTKVSAAVGVEQVVVEPDSPQASMIDFFTRCRSQSYAEAASFLELPRRPEHEAPVVAERLCAVLQSRAIFDLETLSPASAGDPDDGMPRNTDVLTVVRRDDGASDEVRIVRRPRQQPSWVFDRSVVAQIDGWYDELDDIWFREHLPELLLRQGPRGLLWWQWLALPALFVLGWLFGHVIARLVASVMLRLLCRIWPTVDAPRLRRLRAPLTLLCGLALVAIGVPFLRFGLRGEEFVQRLMHGTFLFGLFWMLARTLDFLGEVVGRSQWSAAHPASRSLVPLGRRIGKVVIVAIAIVAFLAELGYPITSLLAGLGIGGLAVALAAQKTVENLFGAFSIGADEPFREGDLVRIGELVGTVEAIGLRSTKIRTFDRTLVSIPNGKLAEMQLESYAARDRLRLSCTLGLVYDTTVAQLRTIVAELAARLREEPKIAPESVSVHVVAFAPSSIDIEVFAVFKTTSWDEFLDIRQELFLAFAELIERAGSSFAFPTRTVHVVDETPKRD